MIPPDANLIYYNGDYPIEPEETLYQLAEDDMLFLNKDNDFVVFVYDDDGPSLMTMMMTMMV